MNDRPNAAAPSHPVKPAFVQLFAYPFRIFFASAALLALLAIPAWLAMLLGGWQAPTLLAAAHWHQHEMLFGFLHAAIAGFLLTAVCVWTSTERSHGPRLALLWSVWLAGRTAMLVGADWPGWLAHALDLSFLPLVMLDAGWRIWRARQRRHLVIMIVLGALWLMELSFHVQPSGPGARGAMLMAMALMLVVGGRITPAFTANWLRLRGGDPGAVRTLPWLESAVPVSMLLLLALVLVSAPAWLLAPVAAGAALAAGARLVLWQGWMARREPLLWILHLALAWIPLALLLLAASTLGWVAPTAWLHAAGVGAMGALILGVMSRVALGHTGRPLVLPPGMTWAFAAVLGAGAVRVATALQWLPWRTGLEISTALWLAAYGLFAVRYWRILAAPRLDGSPG